MDEYKKENETQKISRNNKIGVQQKALDDFETEKAKL